MDALTILAAQEEENIRILESVSGTIEHLIHQLANLGVFDKYKSIHQAYAQLLEVDPKQEALKRALFIQWFSMSEPPFLSGINTIDLEAELLVNTQLDHLLNCEQMDTELISMLQYYSTWEWAFQRPEFMHLKALQAFVESIVVSSSLGISYYPKVPPLNLAEMPNRGGMGKYWLSQVG